MNNKVGIITLNGYFNYGNRLQNYGLEQAISYLGYEPETVIVDTNSLNASANSISTVATKLKRMTAVDISKAVVKKSKRFVYKLIYGHRKTIRDGKFVEFSSTYLKETNFLLSEENISSDITEDYDYFVLGSDQVWNPNFTKASPIYFLRFVERSKRITYAPSFSVPNIPDEYLDSYKQWLCDFKKLSVREADGARLIKELTGLDAPVLVDPTLLLTDKEWLSIRKEASNKPTKNYIVTYFLGGATKAQRRELNNFSKRHDFDVINLGDVREKITYQTGPSEFIDYIKDCSIVLTDSFHGIIFSILFKKPFIAYKRLGGEYMYSRIDNLLELFSLTNRKYEQMQLDEQALKIDYDDIGSILERERKRSFNYLIEGFDL